MKMNHQVLNISKRFIYMCLSWRSLHTLYNSLLGNSLIIISLSTPIALMYNITSFIPSKYPVVLIGAMLSLTGYVLSEILTPILIKDFKDGYVYSKSLFDISKNIDLISEFKVLEENSNKITNKEDGYSNKSFNFISIDSAMRLLGEEKAIRSLPLIKFDFCNKRAPIVRLLLSINFYISLIFIFSSTISHITTIFGA
ncbi:hypothetical protein [Aeromonas sp. 1HA1]|uniref:hypothetical protein n=1 Tax=Aeromonas sp. 1HA1 TaxID=2699193 RepID=UPI0023DD7D6F|nr:hypothetical protein [Aeromonas sp. 1HA1]MDF2415848.1 hypothetical protein [Aeromonas sp. 1HA1]